MNNARSLYLYKRRGAYIPRIAAVHDLCGYGKCSLGVAIPVLSAAGCDVCPVPTSLFSAHTKYPVFHMHDTTNMLDAYLDAWAQEGVEVDAVYSGFLGAPAQVDCIRRIYREHPDALRVVDPVMGDGGEMYPTYTEELCRATADLVDGADLVLPNLTEASILTGIPYEGQDVSDEFVARNASALLEMGAKAIVIKGVVRGDGLIRNFIQVAGGELEGTEGELLPYMLHGTGDLYASGVLAAVMSGRNLLDAVRFSNGFVTACMRVTREQPDYEMRGVSFETELGEVTRLVG